MKKKRSSRLSVVMDLEDRKKQQADKFLADHIKRVENDKIQLVQLETYLSEYQAQYQVTCKQGITVAQLTSYQAFMNKIGTVIDQHKAAMKVNTEQLAGVRQYWMKVYARRNAVDSLIHKVKNTEQQQEDKSLQKLIDETSQLNITKKYTDL
ncbi:MAG: flagellar FliJ protein [Oceanospirillaceae bacterium]|jgi:flagellar FliJ protein